MEGDDRRALLNMALAISLLGPAAAHAFAQLTNDAPILPEPARLPEEPWRIWSDGATHSLPVICVPRAMMPGFAGTLKWDSGDDEQKLERQAHNAGHYTMRPGRPALRKRHGRRM